MSKHYNRILELKLRLSVKTFCSPPCKIIKYDTSIRQNLVDYHMEFSLYMFSSFGCFKERLARTDLVELPIEYEEPEKVTYIHPPGY